MAATQERQTYQSATGGYNISDGYVITTTADWSSTVSQNTGFSGYQQPGTILPYASIVGKGNVVYVGGKPGFGKLSGGVFGKVSSTLDTKTVYALARDNKDTLFAGTLDFGVFRSATQGATWSVASGGLPNLDVYALALDSTGRIYAGTGTGLFISTNNGNTWVPASGFASTKVQAIAVGNGGHVYVATTSYVWFSSNYGGSPWTQLSDGLPMGDITSITIGPDGDVYAGTWGAGVYRRPAWEELTAPATPKPVYPANLATLVPKSFSFVWHKVSSASTYHLQMSTSSLFLVSALNDSTITDTTRAVTLGSADSYYWRVRAKNAAGSSDWSSVFKFAATFTGVETDPAIPHEFHLDQNYPNPFNPSTTIRFGVPTAASGRVKLAVYDLLGREVAVLVNGKKEPGVHQVEFDGSGLGSGMYIYKMTSEGYVQTRKLIVLR
jgi:ligand-binding sensor domain-containing protein